MAEALIALATLTVLEIVLGIDNIVFISIMAGKLPPEQQAKARTFGLVLAMVSRVLLLLSLTWVMRLTTPLFAVFGHEISGRDLILIIGGLFLLAKSTMEIHHRLEGAEEGGHRAAAQKVTLTSIIVQIGVLDIIFSLDSVITAVGMANEIWVMITAVVIAIGVMMLAAGRISAFVDAHPTVKMLALSFLLLIGFSLVAEGLGVHIPKGYIYFAMAFSVFVEMLNLRAKNRQPVQLKQPYVARAQATPEKSAG
ncbi:MAG: TerC family protein [Anaerolineae bacterium]|jgi:predicted tellurium resistance membrane protein TerC|nr:TerC family protein [Anaerolineae bacterium]